MINYYRLVHKAHQLRLIVCLLLLIPTITSGQLQLNFPVSRIVFQRDNSNQAAVPFHAVVTASVTQVKVRLVVRQGGTTTAWSTFTPSNGAVSGSVLSVQGGWYDLEAESFNEAVSLGVQRIDRVGVGEVLIASGQSNAQGFPYTTGASDDRVSCLNYYDGQITESRFPLTFSHLSIPTNVGPTNSSYIYGLLGDKLVQKLGVPVLIYGAAIGGTSSLQWRQTAEGQVIPESSQWDGADDLRPYRAIKATLTHYVQRTGLRAILWHQGESDKGKSSSDYITNIQKVIEASRQDLGVTTLPWMIARASWNEGSNDPNIVAAQNTLISQVPYCYAGPNTDDYGNTYRQDGTHFLQSFYPQLADLWNQALTTSFFQQSTPYVLPQDAPRLTVGMPQPFYQYQGGHLVIPFLDEAPDGPESGVAYTAQLVSSTGQFITNLGINNTRPLRVTLPDNLAAGTYKTRIVSSASSSTLSAPITVFAPTYAKKTGTGLTGKYFSGSDTNGPVLYSQLDGPLDMTWYDSGPTPYMPIRDWLISWTGQIEAPVTGTYIIKSSYDDATRIWINGQLIIDELGAHAYPFTVKGQITLQANQRYDIRVELYQYWYNAQIRLQWVVPGTTQAVYIPKDRLFPASAPVATAGTSLNVVFPTPRTVLQRDNNNTAQINIRGLCPTQTERVEIRVSPTVSGYGQNNDSYVVLDSQPTNGTFSGSVTATSGWYNLDIQAIAQSRVISHIRVTPVGVGEVFVIAGEGNAQGITPNQSVVSAADERVISVPQYNYTDTTRLPLPPTFSKITAKEAIGPHGNTAWCWGELGDLLTNRLNVPVLFYNVAWTGTTVRNWRESMEQGATNTIDNTPMPAGMPYSNLKRVLKDYVSLTGLRAVLWQQGESEYYSTTPQATNYATDLKAVINRSRVDAGFAQLPWIIARASVDNTTSSLYPSGSYEPVTNRQNEVIQTTAQVIAGPITDTIQVPRPNGTYFLGSGLTRLARAWNMALTSSVWSTTALLAQAPTVSDLRLTAESNTRTAAVNQDIPFTINVINESSLPATNVQVRCQLPDQLQFTSSGTMSYQQGSLLASIPSLDIGQQIALGFIARPKQAGIYRIASEIIRADQLDQDSRPNTSIANGEDDVAWIDFRTTESSSSIFSTTASQNAPILPPVISNQPFGDPNKADLSLQIASSSMAPATNSPVSVSLIVRNSGALTAQSVQVGCVLPTGLSFASSSTMALVGNIVRGTIASVASGGQAVLTFTMTPTTTGNKVLQAQIEASSLADPDSTPNNGFTNGEDDTATVTLRAGQVTP
ncbi:sialate O-acetylesterase [Spirosoma litoris]